MVIVNQLVSGIMLAYSLEPESMLVPHVREEEDTENMHIDDFFLIHERGVDLVVIAIYTHLLRKIYMGAFEIEQDYA
jgi:hypothetical protein